MQVASNEITQAFNDLSIDVNTRQLDYLEGDNLNIQCTHSSDFVVGKQTNFNGPVTIINCDFPEKHSVTSCESEAKVNKTQDERIVIRDKVLTASATNTVQNQAVKVNNKPLNKPSLSKPKKQVWLVEFLSRDFIKIPVGAWIVIFAVLIGIIIALSTYLSAETDSLTTLPENPGKSGKIISGGQSFNFFTKKQWGGLNASSTVKINLPVPYVLISHTAGGMCYEKDTCMRILRDIQKDQMSRTPPYADIAYNFLVGGDGNIYEGRGWTNRGPSEGFVNNKHVNINFIGDFSVYDSPTQPQVDAVKALIEYGLNNSMIAQDFSLIAHNATYNTLSPGKNVYKIIKTWPHFDPNPKDHIPDKKNKE